MLARRGVEMMLMSAVSTHAAQTTSKYSLGLPRFCTIPPAVGFFGREAPQVKLVAIIGECLGSVNVRLRLRFRACA